MRRIAALTYYELLRLVQHRFAMLQLFGMPLLFILILGSALSSFFADQPVRVGDIRLAYLMEDNGFVRDSLDRYLNEGKRGGTHIIPVRSRQELEERLEEGEADAGLEVPVGFSDALRKGERPEWHFVQGSNVIKTVAALQPLQSFFDSWNVGFAETGGWAGGDIPLENPPSEVPEGVKRTGWKGTGLSYSALQYYSAHMLVMFLLYSGMSTAVSLVSAKEDHTLARIRTMPVPGWQVLTGKVAGHSAVLLLQAGLIVGGSALLFGTDWGGKPWLLFLTVILVIVFTQCSAVFLALLINKKQYVLGFCQTVIVLMTFLAGGFSPEIGDTLSALGSFTMNHWAAESLLRMMVRDETGVVLERIRMLSAYSGAALLAAVLVYRKAGYHE